MLDYDALFSGDGANAFDAFAPPLTPKPQARANALRTKPTRTSTSVSPTVGADVPVTPAQPQPMGAAQTRSMLGQQAMGDITAAEKEIERYTGPQDYTAMQDYAKQRTSQGQHSLLLALAAQAAGKEFEPIGGAYLKQAMEARTPLKTATGIIDDMGQHIEDPQAKAEQRIKLAQGRMAKAQQILQSNATAEEKAAAQREALALRAEIAAGNQALRAASIAVMQSNKANSTSAAQDRVGGQVQDDFYRQSKDDISTKQSYDNLKATASKAATGGSDLSFIFQYMKMLDPGSVVREGEFANAENSRGIPDSIRNAYNKAMKGVRLTDTQRGEYLDVASRLAAESDRRMTERTQFMAQRLQQQGLNPAIYLPGYAAPATGPQRGPNSVVLDTPAAPAAPGGYGKAPPGKVQPL
jgi:hypothetical protein